MPCCDLGAFRKSRTASLEKTTRFTFPTVAQLCYPNPTSDADGLGQFVALDDADRKLFEEMGGRLALESIEDQGTTVRMMFPAVVG